MAFLNPFFLVGVLAAGIPILVHLVRRTRAQKVFYPSLMFLRKIEQKTVRRRHLRNWLLLALRCLAIMLLALAFARPYFTNSRMQAATATQNSVILIDASASMRYADYFERAKKAVRNVIDNAANGEHLALVSFTQSYEILRPLKNDKAELHQILDQLKPTLAATDYLQAIQAGDAILKETGKGDRKIYLISDFQNSGWNRATTQPKIAADVKLIPIDVGETAVTNLAITDVKADPVIYTQKYSGKVTAIVNNFGNEIFDGTVDFKLNDLAVERREISLDGRASKTIEFTGFNVPDGSNRASIEITNDSFNFDNKNHFIIRRENQTRILAIETPSRGRSESLYLQQALLAGENNRFELTLKSPGNVNPDELNEYRAIIINDVVTLSDQLSGAIKNFVERGGGLIIAAGKHAEASDYNQNFKGIIPATLSDVAQTRGGYALMSQIKADHPVFSPFSKSGRLTSTRVYSYHRVELKETAAVLAALDDGSPVLIEGLAGRGKVLLMTTTLDTAWNDLPLTPMFLPLVRQMLEHLTGDEGTIAYKVGQVFTAPPDAEGNYPAVENPLGGRVEDARRTASGELAIDAIETGFYRLRYREKAENAAVNIDARESDFTRLNTNELIAGVTQNPDDNIQPIASSHQTQEELESKQRWWLPLIILALLFFVAEAILARRIRIAKLVS
ncbi:MAG: BatA domain-containing protein [Acidobacteriota bacterium]